MAVSFFLSVSSFLLFFFFFCLFFVRINLDLVLVHLLSDSSLYNEDATAAVWEPMVRYQMRCCSWSLRQPQAGTWGDTSDPLVVLQALPFLPWLLVFHSQAILKAKSVFLRLTCSRTWAHLLNAGILPSLWLGACRSLTCARDSPLLIAQRDEFCSCCHCC